MFATHRPVRFRNALAISLIAHALLIALPHPALWFPVAGTSLERRAHMSVSFTAPGWKRTEALPPQPGPTSVSGVERTRTASPAPESYHLVHELTRQPQLVSKLDETADVPEATGKAVFRLIVSSGGEVRHVEVIRSTLPRAAEGFAAWKLYTASYRPGEIGGVPVDAEMFVEMILGPATADVNTH